MRQIKLAAVSVVVSAVLFACSSSSPAPSPSKQPTGVAKGGETPKGGTPAAAPTGDPKPEPPATGDACYEACDKQNLAGANVFNDLETKAMACRCAADTCQTACAATACKAGGDDEVDPDAACSACMEGETVAKCDKTMEESCNANADCQKVAQCYESCEGEGGEED
jgi:hypothetical protein